MRRAFPGAFLEIDTENHFPASLVGRQILEHLLPAIKHSDTGRAAHLMARESQEIAADFLHVERPMAGTLGGINQSHNSELARAATEFGKGINCAERVGY